MSDQDRIRIEYLPLSKLVRWPRNPKKHQHEIIGKSFQRFGFVSPIVMDEKSGRLVAGHGRLETLQAAKLANKPQPARIAEKDGEWLVPVIRGIDFNNEHEAEAYLLADNKISEIGGWSDLGLAEMLTEHSHSAAGLTATGFSQDDLDALLKSLGDEYSGAPEETGSGTQSGELKEQWMVVADCKDENDQVDLLTKLKEMGYKVRALVS